MDSQEAYDALIRRAREQSILGSCSALLSWDEQTYMPTGGAVHRGDQVALIAGLQHERATDPRVGELLAELEGSGLLMSVDSVEAVNIREIRRRYNRQVRLPRSLVEELARHHVAGSVGMGRRSRRERLRPLSALAGKDHPAQTERGRVPRKRGRGGPSIGPGG